MNRRASLIVLLLLVATLADAAAVIAKPKKPRGKPAGDYALTISGYCSGTGSAAVSDKVSLTATVKVGSTTGSLSASNLPVVKGYFQGTGTVMGVACTIEGRVDLPNAQDDEESSRQAITGRITGTFKDANGKVGRFVAVQKNPTPDTANNGNGNGPNDNNGNGPNDNSGSGAGNNSGNGNGPGNNNGNGSSGNNGNGPAGNSGNNKSN